jgi:hypothetical protein
MRDEWSGEWFIDFEVSECADAVVNDLSAFRADYQHPLRRSDCAAAPIRSRCS